MSQRSGAEITQILHDWNQGDAAAASSALDSAVANSIDAGVTYAVAG